MGSTVSLSQNNKKPEIISNLPKVIFDEKKSEGLNDKEKETEKEDRVIGSQPVKRRSEYGHISSQLITLLLSVLQLK